MGLRDQTLAAQKNSNRKKMRDLAGNLNFFTLRFFQKLELEIGIDYDIFRKIGGKFEFVKTESTLAQSRKFPIGENRSF